MRGNTQNAIKIPSGALARDACAGTPSVVRETEASASIDGQHSLGMLALNEAVQLAVRKAQRSGMALVTVHNTASTTGALGCASLRSLFASHCAATGCQHAYMQAGTVTSSCSVRTG